MITFRINQQSQVGLRLDKFIVQQMPDYSRTRIQSWIKTKNVLVNGEGKKSGYALEFDDLVEVTIPESEPLEYELIPESLDLDILYEDDSIAVIDKPAGLVVHPGVGNQTGTLVNGLVHHFQTLSNVNGETRPGIVHRLDMNTSGIILVAKSNVAHAALADQFQKRTIKKDYTGLAWGNWKDAEGEINFPIARKKKNPMSYLVSNDGKPSRTKYKIEKQFRHIALVSFYPKTGRTHQIRVHTSYLGYPIFGDEKYGGGISKTKEFLPEFTKYYKNEIDKFNRHALHAKRLEFVHPVSNEKVFFQSPLPTEFINLISSIESFYD